jgi:hypothetical protein
MNIFKRHPIISGIIVFVLFTLPSAINAYLSLYERFTGISVPPLNLGFGVWLLPSIGGVLGILIIWQGRRANKPSELEDIKTALVNIIIYQREVALKKVQQVCPVEIARQILYDYTALFPEDPVELTKYFIERVLIDGNIDTLIGFYKTCGDILDNNHYGLKVELEGNELYKASRMDLAQKRLKLNVGKRKATIIQGNINRVCLLSYGLNSSILVRAILCETPKYREVMPAELRISMEGIETKSEAILNALLKDLEKEWKVTIKKDYKEGL